MSKGQNMGGDFILVTPIQNDAEYEAAIKTLETLLIADQRTDEFHVATTLADAIELYETAQGWDLGEPTQEERERFRREQMGTTVAANDRELIAA